MKILKLEQTEHNRKVGKRCEYIEQNVKDDCMLELDGEIIGFYIKDISKYNEKLSKTISSSRQRI